MVAWDNTLWPVKAYVTTSRSFLLRTFYMATVIDSIVGTGLSLQHEGKSFHRVCWAVYVSKSATRCKPKLCMDLKSLVKHLLPPSTKRVLLYYYIQWVLDRSNTDLIRWKV